MESSGTSVNGTRSKLSLEDEGFQNVEKVRKDET